MQAVAADIEAEGGRALAIAGDVVDRADVQRAVDAVTGAFGPVTFLVNSAGRSQPYGAIGSVDPQDWWAAQAVNVFGPLLFMSAVIPAMRESGQGRIMNIASMAGLMIAPGSSAYTVSKATLIRLSEHVHRENVDAGLAVFPVHPGSIVTDMVLNSMKDPGAPRHFDALDPHQADAELKRVGTQAVSLASGAFDALGGSFLDLETPLDETLALRTAESRSPTAE